MEDTEITNNDCMSGLSESSDDEQPFVVGVRNRIKNVSSNTSDTTSPPSPFRKIKDTKSTYFNTGFDATPPSLSNKRTKTINIKPIPSRYPQRHKSPLTNGKGINL